MGVKSLLTSKAAAAVEDAESLYHGLHEFIVQRMIADAQTRVFVRGLFSEPISAIRVSASRWREV